jgi:hypothetical protein
MMFCQQCMIETSERGAFKDSVPCTHGVGAMYHDTQGREIEDAEMDSMRSDPFAGSYPYPDTDMGDNDLDRASYDACLEWWREQTTTPVYDGPEITSSGTGRIAPRRSRMTRRDATA